MNTFSLCSTYPLAGPPTETTCRGKGPRPPRPRLLPAQWPTTVPAISSFPPWEGIGWIPTRKINQKVPLTILELRITKRNRQAFSFQLWFIFCMKPFLLLCEDFLFIMYLCAPCLILMFLTVVRYIPESKTNVLAIQRTHDNWNRLQLQNVQIRNTSHQVLFLVHAFYIIFSLSTYFQVYYLNQTLWKLISKPSLLFLIVLLN